MGENNLDVSVGGVEALSHSKMVDQGLFCGIEGCLRGHSWTFHLVGNESLVPLLELLDSQTTHDVQVRIDAFSLVSSIFALGDSTVAEEAKSSKM